MLDLHLDDGEGIEVLAALQRHQPNCCAVILTGYASLESAVAAVRYGAHDYLMKPCDIGELLRTVERAVERAFRAKSVEARVTALELELLRTSEDRDRALTELQRLTKDE